MSLTYQRADKLLTGRCRNRRKLCNNTYLYRLSEDIAVEFHTTYIILFYPDGSFRLNTGGWTTVTTKARMNDFSPAWIWSEQGDWFVRWHGIDYAFADGMVLYPDGHVEGAGDMDAIFERRRRENRRRAHLAYWRRAARERKPGRLSVAKILAEENASIRLLKMTAYGIDRFLLEADTTVVDERDGYQLLRFSNGIESWNTVTALKMTCPSTRAVYINTVPPWTRDVASGLDWMFDTKDYLGQIAQQT